MRASLTFALLACTAPFVAYAASVDTTAPSDAAAIASAESAAPAAVAKDAEIVTFDAQGEHADHSQGRQRLHLHAG